MQNFFLNPVSGSENNERRIRTPRVATDAGGVEGVTSGWTSFNARVAGAVAAVRAMADPCVDARRAFEHAGCCGGAAGADDCVEARARHAAAGCCAR
jgi:hypothetical protein